MGAMEMEAWHLRRDGAKVPEHELDGPYLGWLHLDRANIAGQVTLHASLHAGPSRGAQAIPQGLTAVEVRSLDERGRATRHGGAWAPGENPPPE